MVHPDVAMVLTHLPAGPLRTRADRSSPTYRPVLALMSAIQPSFLTKLVAAVDPRRFRLLETRRPSMDIHVQIVRAAGDGTSHFATKSAQFAASRRELAAILDIRKSGQ